MQFVDHEVGDGRFHVQGGCGGDGAAADMDLDGDVIDVGHVADLLDFGDTAAGADVRLDDAQAAVFQEGAVTPAPVDAFTGGQRDVHMVGHLLHHLGVQGHDGLFVVQDAQLLDHAAELDGRCRRGEGVHLHDDVHIGTDGVAHGFQAGIAQAQDVVRQQALEVTLVPVALFVHGQHVHLDGVIAFADGDTRHVGILFRRHEHGLVGTAAPAELELAGVGPDAVTAFAAQQDIQGHVEGLALDVPHGDVEAAHGCGEDTAAALAPEGLAQHLFPDGFRIHGVHADQQGGQILGHADAAGGADAVGEAHFTEAADAFIRVDPDDGGAPFAGGGRKIVGDIDDIDTGDFRYRLLEVWIDLILFNISG